MDPSHFDQHVAERLDALVADAAAAHGEDPAAAGLVVALSGGPDSVALLAATAAWAQIRQVSAKSSARITGNSPKTAATCAR